MWCFGGCSGLPAKKLCEPHTFGTFIETFQKSPHRHRLKYGREGLVMNETFLWFQELTVGTWDKDQTQIPHYWSQHHKMFLSNLHLPYLYRCQTIKLPIIVSLFSDWRLFVKRKKNTRRIHLISIACLEVYEDVSVTVMLDSTRLGLRVTLTWQMLFLFWFCII